MQLTYRTLIFDNAKLIVFNIKLKQLQSKKPLM